MQFNQPSYKNKSYLIRATEDAKKRAKRRLMGSVCLLLFALIILLNVTSKFKPIRVNPQKLEVLGTNVIPMPANNQVSNSSVSLSNNKNQVNASVPVGTVPVNAVSGNAVPVNSNSINIIKDGGHDMKTKSSIPSQINPVGNNNTNSNISNNNSSNELQKPMDNSGVAINPSSSRSGIVSPYEVTKIRDGAVINQTKNVINSNKNINDKNDKNDTNEEEDDNGANSNGIKSNDRGTSGDQISDFVLKHPDAHIPRMQPAVVIDTTMHKNNPEDILDGGIGNEGSNNKKYYVQLIASRNYNKLEKIKMILGQKNINSFIKKIETPDGDLYRLRVGPYKDHKLAISKLTQINNQLNTGI